MSRCFQGDTDAATRALQRTVVDWRSQDVRDATGRLTLHQEFSNGQAAGATHSRAATYDRSGLVTQEITGTWTMAGSGQPAYTTNATTNYSYYEGSVWRGVVTGATTSAWVTSGAQPKPTSTTYEYVWRDQAQQTRIIHDSDTGGAGALQTSTFAYDVNGRVSYVNIQDGRPRNVTFVTDTDGQVLSRIEADNLATADPRTRYWYFNGQRVGEVTNDRDRDSGYFTAMRIRGYRPSATNGPFAGGSNYASPDADFDQAYEALTPGSIRSTGQAWTIRDGDTLQSIAAAAWGDASLWYLIAEHNGLTGASLLTAGQTLTLPAKVANLHNTSETFRPYDPNKALGDLNPTQPQPPKKAGNKGCGGVGQIIMVVIAVAVAALVAPYAIAAVANLGAAAGATTITAASVSTALAAGTAGSLVGSTALIAGGAIAGAAASVASQAFGLATGMQDSFDWKGLALSAISGGVGAGVGSVSSLAGNGLGASLARGAISSVVTQGVAVATGLQDRFSWTNVAVGAVMSGVGSKLGPKGDPATWTARDYAQSAVANAAAAAAGAAVQSLVDGSSFGDNLIANLPQAIGQTIGNMVAGGIAAKAEATREVGLRRAGVDRSADEFMQMFGDTAEVEAYREAGLAAAADPGNQEARTNFDRAARMMLEANSDDPAVSDFFQGIDQSRRIESRFVAGSNASGPEIVGDQQAPEIDDVVVYGNREYLLGSTIDKAGIWVGEVKNEVGQAVGQYVEDNPGVGIALTLADGAFAVVAPAKYLGGVILNHFEEQASGLIADQMDGPDMWARDLAEAGGDGFVFAGTVVLGGFAALRRGRGPNRADRVVTVEGYQVGPHGGIRPNGGERHHGVNDHWARGNKPGYSRSDAPTILLSKDQHNATRGEYNRWLSEQRRSNPEFQLQKAPEPLIRAMAERQLTVARIPEPVRIEYWRQYDEYISGLPNN